MTKGDQLGDKATVAAKSRPEGKSGRENSWETKQQWQPRAAQKEIRKGEQLGDKATAAAKSSPEGKS